MKQGFEWKKRSVAAVLALAMLLSCIHFAGVPRAQALKDTYTSSGGALVAENYGALTQAERELLVMLGGGGSFTYDAPTQSDALVSVDADAATVTALEYSSLGFTWKPVAAELHDPLGNTVEKLTLSGGKGSYSYSGTAFTVHVTYGLDIALDTAVQAQLLDNLRAVANIKKAADSIYSAMDDLDMIVTAMDALVQLRNGITYNLGPGINAKLQLEEPARNAVDVLHGQYKANGGKLDLQLCLEAYGADPMAYLSGQGKEFQQTAQVAYEAIHVLAADPTFTLEGMDTVISTAAPGMTGAWKTLKSALKKADTALAPGGESWPAASGSILPAGLEAADYQRMAELADALNAQQSIAQGLTLKQQLRAAERVITCNSSMVDVALKIELRYYDETNTLVSEPVEQTLTAGEGESLWAVQAAAEELEKTALASFEAQGFDLNGYARSIETNISDSLAGVSDAVYTVVYTPRDCTVRFAYDGTEQTVGYGWHLTLEAYPGTDKVYDYTVGGTYYPQNSVYKVSGDVTVDRAAMKPATQTDLLSIIARCYGTDKETAILTSGALKGNEFISLRYPDNDDGKLIVAEAGKLTVGTYNSGYKGRHWLPYSYTVGDQTGYFKGAGTVNVSAAGVDSIPVVYRLELTDISSEQVQKWLDDVKTMSGEAAGQLAALEKLNAQYNGMGQINKAMLNMLKNSIYDFELHEDWETNEELQDYMVEVLGYIVRDCVDTNGKLRIYNMLAGYRDTNGGGLVYYYRNSASFIAEIELLSGYLSDMLGSEDRIRALQIIMNELGYPQYADRFTELEALMKEVSGDLLPPHERIDTQSADLDVLVQALTMSGTVGTTGARSPYLEETFQVAAPNKAVLQITVSAGGRILGTVSKVYELEDAYVLTQADVDDFKAQIQAIADSNLQSKYYTQTVDVELDSLVGRVMDSNVLIKNVWTPIPYTVHIETYASQTITVENPVVTLPEPNTGFRNDYSVDGVICGSGTYRFTAEQLDRLFAGGSYTVTVTKINVAAERLEAFLAELNEAGDGTMEFHLNPQKDTVTVNVAAGNQAALNACIQDVAMAMLGGYGYIGLDGRGFLYANEKGNTEISLQTVYDAVLHDDGFSHETLIELQDGEGVLTMSTVQLGDSADALEQDLNFMIYLTSASEQLKSVGRAMEQMEGDLTFRANNGVLDVHIDLREQVYQGLLSGMLLTGRVEQADLNAPSGSAAVAFLLQCMDQMVADETVTMTTYENTLALLGWETDMAGDQLYYEYIAGILRNAVVTEQADGCRMLQTIDVKTGLDEAAGDTSMAPVLGTIKEYNTEGILVDMYLTMELRDCYEAMILDAENGMYYTRNLARELDLVSEGATVVLLCNVTADLILPDGAVLDLNGYTLSGNVTASGALAIVDSTVDTLSRGKVSGALSGEITVWGGSFAADVTAMLAEGRIQQSGIVRSEYYTVRQEADGSVTYEIDFDKPFRSGDLAVDIALDMLLDGMSTAKLAAEDHVLYDLVRYAMLTKGQRSSGADLSLSILDALQSAGMGELVARIAEALANYEAAAGGKALGTVGLTKTPWEMEIRHIAEGDYLDFNLITSDRTAQVQAHMVMDGGQAQYLKELFPDTRLELSFSSTGADGLQAAGKATWNVDLTARKEYAAILGVILGYAHESIRPQIASAINRADTQALKNIFNSLTVEQLLQALRAMNPNVDFAAMAKTVGITADISAAAKAEAAVHSRLCGMGLQLASWEVTGGSAKLGSFESKAGDGSYVITGLKISSGTVHTLGMTPVEAAVELTEVTIRLAGIHKAEAYDVIDAKGSVTLSGNDAQAALKALKAGYTLRINQPSVVNFWTVKTGFHVENAKNITVGGFLLSEGVTVTADGPLQVYTAASGYTVKTVKSGNTYTYTLEAIQAPTCGKDLAKAWTAKLDATVYLYVDADPSKGVTLEQLKANLTFAQFASLEGNVNYSITGYKDRVKTGDKLTVTVTSGSLNLAKVEYTVIITGDVNKDGRVNAGDAVAMMKIYKGQTSAYTTAQIMAADANRNGNAEKPRVDAGDAVRIMKKYMDWKTYLATESGK